MVAPNPASSITVAQGAGINALTEGSYVGIVAPRVEMAGNVRVNGSAGYIAAEAVDLTINDGLFNIVVQTGSEDANGIVHGGNTGGPASTGAGDNHKIYMVAVPKNQALTMILEGSVGFEAATSATVENGEIILSSAPSLRTCGRGRGTTCWRRPPTAVSPSAVTRP